MVLINKYETYCSSLFKLLQLFKDHINGLKQSILHKTFKPTTNALDLW